ncbi:MAG: carbohydrate kinase family protein [Rectinema sp.]|jgi:sugar/nucleoside kinase (ribokinase family)
MLTISGTGCALMDYLHADIRLDSEAFLRYRARRGGDGGLEPGKLVFVEDLERFAGEPFSRILEALRGGQEPDRANLGGPSIVSLIHAAQMLEGHQAQVQFFGARGVDASSDAIMHIVSRTPLEVSGYLAFAGHTPFTQVFSDPTYDHGHGERTFVNERGVADLFAPGHLPERFFDAEIVAFGGTALVPQIHDNLDLLCRRAHQGGSIVVVNTAYDFQSEVRRTAADRALAGSSEENGARWPLGARDGAYRHIDVLVADREEALKLSGADNVGAALAFFRSRGTSAAIVTDGARDIHFYSDGRLFAPQEEKILPVSAEVRRALGSPSRPKGDTTGCGDNFVGGLLASLALQLEAGQKRGAFDIIDACSMAIVSGGFSCFYLGGTYLEEMSGEKRRKIEALYGLYLQQLSAGS